MTDLDLTGSLPPFHAIIGVAGTGKSTIARQLAEERDDTLLCATTGIAAVNLGSVTLNSLLWFYDTASLQTSYEVGRLNAALRTITDSGYTRLVIDEVSMMDGRQLDILCLAFDDINARRMVDGLDPIGITLVGDFCQLPPIDAPFVFERPSWARFAAQLTILTHPWRQTDPEFLAALGHVRRGDGAKALEYFGRRLNTSEDPRFDGTAILAKNAEVDRFNNLRMLSLPEPTEIWKATRVGDQSADWKNIPPELALKEGALVMILANRRARIEGMPPHTWPMIYANGDLGYYHGKYDDHTACVELKRTGQDVEVPMIVREKTRITGARGVKAKREDVLGTISYMPLRIAYATTCHKCVAFDTRVNLGGSIAAISALHIGAVLRTGGPVEALAATTRQAFRIVTERGYQIVASAEHRWETPKGWIATHDLYEKRASVALDVGVCRIDAEDDYAWWLGAMVGNGTYNDRREGQLHFSTTYGLLGNRWQQLTLELGAAKASWRKDHRGLHATAKPLRLRLLADGLDYVTCKAKRIPAYIWKAGPGAWRSFIRGLFDTDGSVGRARIVLTTAAEGLGIEVQELLLHLGVVSDRRRYPGRVDPYWQVSISAASLQAFRAIGFWHPLKDKALTALHPNRVIKPFNGYDPVVDVRDLGVLIPMIDVEVAAPHVIGTGPFRSHNSQGLTLDAVQVFYHSHFWRTPGMFYTALSRARTMAGLRLVGTPAQFVSRCRADARVRGFL